MEEVVARPSLTDVTCGGAVRPTARTGLSQQPDVALLAPGGAPAVPHNPVIALGSVSAVANKLKMKMKMMLMTKMVRMMTTMMMMTMTKNMMATMMMMFTCTAWLRAMLLS